jgi:hypothetical protein
VITQHELEHRLGIAIRALAHHDQAAHPARRASLDRITAAHADLEVVLTGDTLAKAHRHLAEHQAGYSTNSMPEPTGRGGVSDRTGETVVAPYADPDDPGDRARHDTVTDELTDLDQCSARLQHDALHLLCSPDVNRLSRQVEADASRLRWILKRWAREPDMRWCTHCWKTNRHREPVHLGRYKDLCRECGEWRAVNKKLPHADFLPYLQRHERHRIPVRLLNKHRAKLPRPRTRKRDA